MNNSTPLVSVLMTAFNREKFIGEAIESVINSTYKNWELIIVDDCSSDQTVDIARYYEEKDSRIKVYINEVNLGDYPNRNHAASFAKGKYLKYVDADDLIYPHGLEVIVNSMEFFPEAGWGLMSMPQDEESIFPILLPPKEIYLRHFFKSQVFHKAPLSAVIKTDIFWSEAGFKNVRHYGDMELWLRLSLNHSLILMQSGLVWYRSHEGQEAKKRKNNLLLPMTTANLIISYLKNDNNPLATTDKSKAIKKINNYKINLILKQLIYFRIKTVYQLVKVFKKYSNIC